jgi:hypothetical protein
MRVYGLAPMAPLLIISYSVMILLCILAIANEKSYGDSPSFAKQEIIDYTGDWSVVDPKQPEVYHNASFIYRALEHLGVNVSDISTVNLSSDGKILNITFWLSGLFNEKPVRNIPVYYIKFDADSNLLTGDSDGGDYLFVVRWNNDTKTWEEFFQEYSRVKNIRFIEYNSNYSNFFSKLDSKVINKQVNYTDFSQLLLSLIPDRFEINELS